MSDRVVNDAYNIKKLMREAEALADESMLAFARLKQAMLTARLNPSVEVHTGQRALIEEKVDIERLGPVGPREIRSRVGRPHGHPLECRRHRSHAVVHGPSRRRRH